MDVSFDLDTADPAADGMQEADSRQIETYSCGHTVVGPRLSSADPEAMTVERRTSDETTMPDPGVSTAAADDPPVSVRRKTDELVDEASEESFPASDRTFVLGARSSRRDLIRGGAHHGMMVCGHRVLGSPTLVRLT